MNMDMEMDMEMDMDMDMERGEVDVHILCPYPLSSVIVSSASHLLRLVRRVGRGRGCAIWFR